MNRESYICQIQSPDGSTGSGFLVAYDLVLTCAHVLGTHDQAEIRWPKIFDSNQPTGTVVWRDAGTLDAVLLRIPKEDSPRGAVPGFLSSSRIAAATPFISGGYAKAGEGIGDYVPIHGGANPLPDTEPHISLHIEQALEDKTDWGGLSGAPVFSETGSLIGIIASLPAAFTGQDLQAICSSTLLQNKEFAELIAHEAKAERRGKVVQRIEDTLANHPVLKDWLVERFPELVRDSQVAPIALLDLTIVDFLQGLNDLQIRAVKRNENALKKEIYNLCAHICPLLFQREHQYQAWSRVMASGMVFDFPACHPVLAELIVAGAHDRPAAFVGDGMDPEVDLSPPFIRARLGYGEESGFPVCGGSPSQMVKDFHMALSEKCCHNAPALRGKAEPAAIQASAAFLRQRARQGMRWYFTFVIQPEDLERFEPAMDELQQTYPELPLIRLLDDGETDEGYDILWLLTWIVNRAEHDYSN